MRAAIAEAHKALGRTHPNPSVGAVVVKDGRILARGHTAGRPGAPHAEVMALEQAGALARGADLYTTLEPCDHFGRTPPCSRAILAAGIRRVITGPADPNPLVQGKGVTRLRRGGVEVIEGVLGPENEWLNRAFFKFMRSGRPWVTLKAAVTLDGKLASSTGDSKWVTGEAARAWVHRLRDEVDAVLVGANTVRLDDPKLTTRLPRGGRDPVRVVLDSKLSLKPARELFQQTSAAPTIIVTGKDAPASRERRLLQTGAQVWRVPAKEGRVSLPALMKRLGAAGHFHLLVEGGSAVFASFLKAQLADELYLFLAPKILGGEGKSWVGALGNRTMEDAARGRFQSLECVGEDVLLHLTFPGG